MGTTVPTATSPTLAPGIGGGTAPPTHFLRPWLIGDLAVSLGNNGTSNYLDDGLTVTHQIGAKINSTDDIQIKLMKKDCVSLSATSNEVVSFSSNVSTSFTAGDVTTQTPAILSYDISIDASMIGNSNSEYLTCAPQSHSECSVGSIQFCTRVSTFSESIDIDAQDTNFILWFNMTDNNFSIEEINFDVSKPENFTTDLEPDFNVDICQCDADFECISPGPLQKDMPLVTCIFPTHSTNGVERNVKIFNFNLDMIPSDGSDSFTFSPILMGPDSWDQSAVSIVKVDDDDYKIQILMPVPAQFYIQGKDSVDVTGNAALEFKSSKVDSIFFKKYSLQVGLAGLVYQGCFQSLILKIQNLM